MHHMPYEIRDKIVLQQRSEQPAVWSVTSRCALDLHHRAYHDCRRRHHRNSKNDTDCLNLNVVEP